MSSKSKGGTRGGAKTPQRAPAAPGPPEFSFERSDSGVKVNLSVTPRPERQFNATWAKGLDAGPFVHLLFSDPIDDQPKVPLVLVYEVSKQKLKEAFTSDDWATKLLQLPIKGARQPYQIDTADAKYHVERSNLVSLAFSDVDAEIQFFHISPREVADVVQRRRNGLQIGNSFAVLLGVDILCHLVRDVLELL